MAALEAMACGTPVVLSHGCHLDEVHERAGLVVPGTAQEAASAIVSVLSDDALRSKLGAGAIEFAHGYRREVVMPQMIEVLEPNRRDRSVAAAYRTLRSSSSAAIWTAT